MDIYNVTLLPFLENWTVIYLVKDIRERGIILREILQVCIVSRHKGNITIYMINR